MRAIKHDPIVRVPLARLSVSDVERWHARLRRAGVSDPAIRNQHTALRAALSQAVRWGWASSNAASLARLRSTKAEPRQAMSLEDVHAVLAAAATVDPAAEVALRLAAVAGARRAELAALRWDDVRDGLLTIDSAIETVRRGGGHPELRDAPTKTANVRTVALDADTLALIERVRRRARAVRAVDVRARSRSWSTRTGSAGGGGDRGPWPASTRSGACTISVIGRPRWPSARATTSAPSPAASATPTPP